MKKLIGYLLVAGLILSGVAAHAQISNTVNTITINTAVNSDGCHLPAQGTYTMDLKYVDQSNGSWVYYNGVTVSITWNNATTYTIDAGAASPAISFPYNNGNDFVLTVGQIDLTGTTGSRSTLFWQYDFTTCSALPVTLVYFRESLQTGNTVKLTWQTATEINSSYFEVQRSMDGVNWFRLGTVAAAGNSSALLNYSFTDNAPGAMNYYRLKTVDIDGQCEFSKILWIRCSACTATAPSVPCSYSISGPASFCGTNVGSYSLSATPPSYGSVNWSVSPSSASISVNSCNTTQVTLVENASPVVVALTASVAGCSSGGVITKYIIVGTPPLNVSSTQTTNPCTGATVYNVTVQAFPGTSASQYLWYQNGSYLGSGLQRHFSSTSGDSYQIVFNGPCGQSTYNGYSGGDVIVSVFKVSPNPSATTLNIAPVIINCPPPPPSSAAQSGLDAAGKAAMDASIALPAVESIGRIQIYNNFGILQKEVSVNSKGKSLSIDMSSLPTGNYLLRIYYNKNKVETQKIRVER